MISLPLKVCLFLLIVCPIQSLGFADQRDIPRYDPKTFFLPNYARSFPGFVDPFSIISTNPAYAPVQHKDQPKVEETGPSFREDLTSFDEGLGFHLGGELEARSLDLSPIFRQPVSTLDLLRETQLRLLPTPEDEKPNLLTVTAPTIRPTTSNDALQDQFGDPFNPFFRPVYARPPPPPPRSSTTIGPDLCKCPCTSFSATTESSSSVATTVIQSDNLKVTTDKNQSTTTEIIKLQNTDVIVAAPEPSIPSDEEVENPSGVQTDSSRGKDARSSQPSIAQLVQQAFNSTRQNTLEDNTNASDLYPSELTENNAADIDRQESSSFGSSDGDDRERKSGFLSEETENETTTEDSADVTSAMTTESTSALPLPEGRADLNDVIALPVEGTTVHPLVQLTTTSATISANTAETSFITTPSNMVSTKIHVQEKAGRAPKKAGLVDELLLPAPKQAIPGFPAKGSNRRFNNLLDLSLRRGGHKA